MSKARSKTPKLKLPPSHDWRTTDIDEINKRKQRAREETFVIANTAPKHPIFSNFRVKSPSGLVYSVEVRDLAPPQLSCTCVDYRINGLGLCKHTEAVLLYLQRRFSRLLHAAKTSGSTRWDVVVNNQTGALELKGAWTRLPSPIAKWFNRDGAFLGEAPEAALPALQALSQDHFPQLRVSQEVEPWLENRRRIEESHHLRREYELKVQRGEWPVQETTVPLFPYQREGMLHLAFAERALLADEMGLGKTIQAIAACALLHRLGKARRVLVVTPASLKSEWEEQIRRFTPLDYQIVWGSKNKRLESYRANPKTPFFTIVNYEQLMPDSLDINERLAPDVIVLDEAQRIKNWNTKTAQAAKRLRGRYAFVLTGTPIENRIDELHSLMDFLNPSVLGPLFKFNREFFNLDERGRPDGYRNLDVLHQRIKPFLLRRRKADVETELPPRTDRNFFVPLSPAQRQNYETHELRASRLVKLAATRPLTKEQQEVLQRELAMMRMICDTNYILDRKDATCPKLAELARVLDDCQENGAKVIVFSEWQRMLELVRGLCSARRIGYAWHTGEVPQHRRRGEINAFKNDPKCRVFLSTDSGATGLNLQTASVVINCDLPWNPAKLEQRIARAWRKQQTQPVTVINLISEDTIEHRMLETLAMKQTIAASVLDEGGKITELKLRGGRQAFLERLQQLLTPASPPPSQPSAAETAEPGSAAPQSLPRDPGLAFARLAHDRINGALVRCEERYPETGPHSVLLVVLDREPALWQEKLSALHADLFGPGKIDPLAPVQLEVIDRATDQALQRLAAAGLIRNAARASRPLFPIEDQPAALPLSPEEKTKAAAHRDRAARKLKMARVLGEGGLGDEARSPLLDAALAAVRARAIEGRLPEPQRLEDAFLPPLSHLWAGAVLALKDFAQTAEADWKPAAQTLSAVLSDGLSPSG